MSGLTGVLTASGHVMETDTLVSMAKEYAKTYLSHRKKFPVKEDFAINGLISQKTREHLDISEEEWPRLWQERYRSAVREGFLEKRNGLVQEYGKYAKKRYVNVS